MFGSYFRMLAVILVADYLFIYSFHAFCAVDLLKVAPGLPDGMTFKNVVSNSPQASPPQGKDTVPEVINLADILADTGDFDLGDSEDEESAKEEKEVRGSHGNG